MGDVAGGSRRLPPPARTRLRRFEARATEHPAWADAYRDAVAYKLAPAPHSTVEANEPTSTSSRSSTYRSCSSAASLAAPP